MQIFFLIYNLFYIYTLLLEHGQISSCMADDIVDVSLS